MGCYDTIFVPCPKCGEEYEAQSKSGDCLLRHYTFGENVPEDVLSNVNRHAPFACDCGAKFEVDLEKMEVVLVTEERESDFSELMNLPENPTREDIEKSFLLYRKRIDNK